MKQAADIDGELVYAGIFRTLRFMLRSAETDADYRPVVAEIGRELRADGQWRAQWKLAEGWDGQKTAWEATASFIQAHRTENPWWSILDYADGQPVSDETQKFFEETKR